MSERVALEVRRDDLSAARIGTFPIRGPAAGEVLIEVERFALTANNVTYGLMGEMIGYWDFFPPPRSDPAWGTLPAMGWGRVVESAVEGIDPGGRYYGWFPMASHCLLTASTSRDGLRDIGPHREEHAPVYKRFVRTDLDPLHRPGEELEDRHALLRGLFVTGYLIDEALAAEDFHQAAQVVILSASSKTAIALAQQLFRRSEVDTVGLTSSPNVAFVESLGLYGRVLAYDDLDQVRRQPSVAVDMSGNGAVVGDLHEALGGQLAHSMIVGMSHHDAEREQPTTAPRPVFFFAPGEISRQVERYGRDGYEKRLAESLDGFVEASKGWLSLDHRVGPDRVAAAWSELVAGEVQPSTGLIASLSRGKSV